MSPPRAMTAASVGSWAVAAVLIEPATRVDLLLGMLGPLFAVTGSWVLIERTFRARPEGLTAMMVTTFAVKIVFFGFYVAVVLRMLAPRSGPFVASFTSYFTGLYAMEALYLRRLFR